MNTNQFLKESHKIGFVILLVLSSVHMSLLLCDAPSLYSAA